MAVVVFLRGVNVGGKRVFRPAALAQELAPFDVVQVGAAGTFVARRPVAQATLRAALRLRLPFAAECMLCQGRQILALVDSQPFGSDAPAKGVRRYVSILTKLPPSVPPLPFTQPAGSPWQVKIVGVHRRYVLSEGRRSGKAFLYPNEVVERKLGVPATTRSWDTILKVHEILQRERPR